MTAPATAGRRYRRAYRVTHRHKQRARKNGHNAVFAPIDWLRCLDYWQGRCAYCKRRVGASELTIDHFIPLSSPLSGGTTVTNVLPACERCNRQKQSDDPFVFLWRRYAHNTDRAQGAVMRIMRYFAQAETVSGQDIRETE